MNLILEVEQIKGKHAFQILKKRWMEERKIIFKKPVYYVSFITVLARFVPDYVNMAPCSRLI